MKIYNLEYLEKLIENPSLLKEEIIASKGFIFYFFQQENINLPLDLLINTISNYSLRYISIKFNDFTQFSTEQLKIYNSFIKEEIVYSIDELLEDLKNKTNIPNAKKNLIDFDFTTFKNNKNILILFFDNNFSLFNNSKNLNKMLLNIDCNELLSLGEKFLIKHPFLMNSKSIFLKNEQLKNIYIKAVDNYYSLEHHEYKQKPKLNDFLNFNFTLKDKQLAEKLLMNEYSEIKYNKLNNFNELNNLFTKLDFFEQFNFNDLSSFTTEEIITNKKFIQNIILNKYLKNQNYLFKNNIDKYNLSLDNFKIIFDEEFIKNVIIPTDNINISDNDKNNLEHNNYLIFTVTKIVANNEGMLSYCPLENIIKYFTSIYKYYTSTITEDYVNNIQKILNTRMNEFLHPNFILKDITSIYSSELFIDILKSNLPATTNCLYFLLDGYKYYNSKINGNFINHHQEEIKQQLFLVIQKIAEQLPDLEVQKLKIYFHCDIDLKGNNLLPSLNYSENLFAYSNIDFKTIKNHTLFYLLDIDTDFQKYILNNNLTISNLNKDCHDPFFLLLYQVNSTESPLFKFLKNYISNNKEFIITNYEEQLIPHIIRKDLIEFDTTAKELESYNKIIILLNEKNNLPEESFDNKETHKKIYQKIDNLSKLFSYEYSSNKIKELINDKKYNDTLLLLEHLKSHKSLLINHINQLKFEDLLIIIENPLMMKFINDNNSNNPKSSIVFNNTYSKKQNILLANLLLSKTKDVNNNVLNIINFFDNTNETFIKEFLINNDPLSILNSYKAPKFEYSTQDIIFILNNIENKYGNIFPKLEETSNYNDVIALTYLNKENEYKEILNYYKTKPITYLFLSYTNNYTNFINKNDTNKSNAEVCYFKENFDFNILNQGISAILKLIENNDSFENISTNNAYRTLDNFIYSTYSYKSHYNKQTFFSPFTEEESLSMIKNIWNVAPQYLIHEESIGSIENINSYISNNFEKFYYDGFIEEFFLDFKSIENNKYNAINIENNLKQIFNSFCIYLIKNKKQIEINQVLHFVEEYKFNINIEHKIRNKEYFTVNLDLFIENNMQNILTKGNTYINIDKKLNKKSNHLKKHKI